MEKVEKHKRKEMLVIFGFWIVCILVSVCMYGTLNTIIGLGNFFVGVVVFFGGIVCFCIGITLPGMIVGGILWLILGAILKIFGVLESFIKFWDKFKRNFNYRLNNFIDKNEEKILNFIIQYIFPLIFLIGMIVFSPYDNGSRDCYDKTSVDYNWKNDMKCINEKGDIKRTDYEGAKKLMGK